MTPPRRRAPSIASFAIALLMLPSAWSAVPAAQASNPRQRTVVASVFDRKDLPVGDLTTKDFTVKEDGASREVIAVDPASPPTHLVLLVDDSQAIGSFPRDVRQALIAFADRMADAEPAPAMRLTTFGARPTVRVDFTSFSGVSTAIERITPATGSGATLLDALIETCRDLRALKIENAALVVFLAESGPEFSTVSSREVETALQSVRATLWTVVLQEMGGTDLSPERRERASVVGDVAARSGGGNTPVLAPLLISRALTNLADRILARVQITYGRPDTLIPPSRLEVTGRDRNWRIQVSRWPAR